MGDVNAAVERLLSGTVQGQSLSWDILHHSPHCFKWHCCLFSWEEHSNIIQQVITIILGTYNIDILDGYWFVLCATLLELYFMYFALCLKIFRVGDKLLCICDSNILYPWLLIIETRLKCSVNCCSLATWNLLSRKWFYMYLFRFIHIVINIITKLHTEKVAIWMTRYVYMWPWWP